MIYQLIHVNVTLVSIIVIVKTITIVYKVRDGVNLLVTLLLMEISL